MIEDNYKVAAVVVTFNRKILLEETINALLKSSYKLNEIIIVNNASTDGTEEVLNKYANEIVVLNLNQNIGGAGGFNEGIKSAYNRGNDLIWIMDDDTIVKEDTLLKMVEKIQYIGLPNLGYLCSNVLWKDETPCLMNVPRTHKVFNDSLENSMIRIQNSTFVSMLISRKAIKECGLPIKEFFIWSDDTEYTKRLGKKFKNYLVTDSIVIHKMNNNLGADIIRDTERLERYVFSYRNKFYIGKKYGSKELIKYLLMFIMVMFKVILKSEKKIKKIIIMFKGFFKGLVFNPKIEMMEDK